MIQKKKPIVALRKGQNYVSGRVVTEELNKEIKAIAKKL
jgi:biotin operon repressor